MLDNRSIDWGTTGKKVNARNISANFTPTNYTPTQVGSEGTDKVSAHLKGLDLQLANAGSVVPFSSDLSFNGSDTQKDVDVSSTITDARKAIWALHDNANGYERIFCKITATSTSNVRINTNIALASGTYRLIGLEDIS